MLKGISSQKFFTADNIKELQKYPDNSLDAICTDAPYGLGKEPNVVEMLNAWITTGYLEVKGGGFMGKKWDSFVPQPLFWKEVFRVLKPGGHVLCFFGTRTYDWGVMAMRIAGFEIRDQIQWLYGSGFPKSLNISKAIDKAAGAEREIIGQNEDILKKQAKDLREGKRKIAQSFNNGAPDRNNGFLTVSADITAPATDEAKQWNGYGTALKPANEPIVLARKPLEKGLTIIQNVLKWGTGALNIDGCRIGFTSDQDKKSAVFGRGTNIIGGNYVGATHGDGRENIEPNNMGRFPANVLLDEEAALSLDEQTGLLKSGIGEIGSGQSGENTNGIFNAGKGGTITSCYGDTGGASRFFYIAKASQSERNKGCEDLYWQKYAGDEDVKLITKDQWDLLPEEQRLHGNFHPTVKPVKLMRYCVRMITPPGGTCADPFNGSGTTGIACELEDINFIGIDNVPSHIIISEARLSAYKKIAAAAVAQQQLISPNIENQLTFGF